MTFVLGRTSASPWAVLGIRAEVNVQVRGVWSGCNLLPWRMYIHLFIYLPSSRYCEACQFSIV